MGLKGSGGLLKDWVKGYHAFTALLLLWRGHCMCRSCKGGPLKVLPGCGSQSNGCGTGHRRPILEFERGGGVSKGLRFMALGVEKPRSLQRVLRLHPAAAFSLTQAFDSLGRNIARNPAGRRHKENGIRLKLRTTVTTPMMVAADICLVQRRRLKLVCSIEAWHR